MEAYVHATRTKWRIERRRCTRKMAEVYPTSFGGGCACNFGTQGEGYIRCSFARLYLMGALIAWVVTLNRLQRLANLRQTISEAVHYV